MLFHVFGTSSIIKREAQPPHLVATRSQHTYTHPIKRSTHHGHPPPQRTYRPPATNRHPQKSSEHFAHYLLTLRTRRAKRDASNQPASKQKSSEQNAHYLLTTFLDAGQGELTHPGHRLSKRILPCGTYFVTVHHRR